MAHETWDFSLISDIVIIRLFYDLASRLVKRTLDMSVLVIFTGQPFY